jgi:anti-sigma factor RsiW
MSDAANQHARASELLTWMVNGRLDGPEAHWLNEHLQGCAACRDELAAQRRIRDALVREPTVEFAPQASFNRLWKRIEADALDVDASTPAATGAAARTAFGSAYSGRLRASPWMRAVLAAQAAAILVLGALLWQRLPVPAYRTMTEAAPALQVSGPVVKAIFDDQVRLTDVKEILAAAGLVVAAGPSEAGVYTLVARDGRSTAIPPATLARLRADPRVRFAEPGAQ